MAAEAGLIVTGVNRVGQRDGTGLSAPQGRLGSCTNGIG